MARKQVVEVQCDRCSRTEHRTEPDSGDLDSSTINAFFGKMPGAPEVVFGDLCTPCMKTVRNHLEQIAKKIDGLSPDRASSKLEELVKALPHNEEEKPRGPEKKKSKVIPMTVDDSHVTPMTVDE